MVIALIVLSFLFIITGIAGSILPGIPGLPISWIGILLLYFIPQLPYDWWILGISGVLMLLISIADFVLPSITTKKYGGSKYGIWGTNIGLIVGLIAPIPLGFIIGPFVGALIGELFFNKSDEATSIKAATGSFIGFLASTFMKFVFSIMFLGLWIYIIWNNYSVIFLN